MHGGPQGRLGRLCRPRRWSTRQQRQFFWRPGRLTTVGCPPLRPCSTRRARFRPLDDAVRARHGSRPARAPNTVNAPADASAARPAAGEPPTHAHKDSPWPASTPTVRTTWACKARASGLAMGQQAEADFDMACTYAEGPEADEAELQLHRRERHAYRGRRPLRTPTPSWLSARAPSRTASRP